jgi:ubiquinone/menaquinone biosynthesis C-methylase UbiE
MSDSVRSSYDSAAESYAEQLFDELSRKPLDRHLLNRFAEEMKGAGRVADLGCGPGHVAKYLHDAGTAVIGVDISSAMIEAARRRISDVEFVVGDMRSLDFEDHELAGVVLFYSIVHFDGEELPDIFAECRRVVAPDALLIAGFHVGDEIMHLDELFGQSVSLDFRFHQPEVVAGALARSGFNVIERIEREPYPGAEHPSRRCYLIARAV